MDGNQAGNKMEGWRVSACTDTRAVSLEKCEGLSNRHRSGKVSYDADLSYFFRVSSSFLCFSRSFCSTLLFAV